MNKIEVSVTRGSDGKIDVNATLASWHNDLAVFAAKEDADLDTIAQAVERVWSDHPGLKAMNLDALASYTLRNIPGVDPAAFNEVTDRIKEYVRTATDTFALTKGKNGGVQFLARLSSEERTKVEAQRAKASEKAAAKAA